MLEAICQLPYRADFWNGASMGLWVGGSWAGDRMGREENIPIISLFAQYQTTSKAITQTVRCLETAKVLTLPSTPQVNQIHMLGIGLLIGSVAVCSYQSRSTLVQRTAQFVADHMVAFNIMVTAVASVALIVLGQPILGVTSLTCIAVSMLGQTNLFPSSVKTIIQIAGLVLTASSVAYFSGIKTLVIGTAIMVLVPILLRYNRKAIYFMVKEFDQELMQKNVSDMPQGVMKSVLHLLKITKEEKGDFDREYLEKLLTEKTEKQTNIDL